MQQMLIIFDIDSDSSLAPMTDLRAAFDVRTGIFTSRQRIERVLGLKAGGLWVPPRLAALVESQEDPSMLINALPTDDRELLLVNGRWLAPDSSVNLKRNQALVAEGGGGEVLMARLSASDAQSFLEQRLLPDSISTRGVADTAVLRHPWDVITHRSRTFDIDAAYLRIADAAVVGERATILGKHPVELAQSAVVAPNTVFDAEHGPIIVDEQAIIRPGVILCGPCYVGRGSVVIDRAHIRANTVIGRSCKIGGEVGGTIFQGYSNKSHEGHLGDSWVGEWVNFGAGTTNSNLLNTYGEVTMRLSPSGQRRKTGLTFLGSIVGDHAKFAILTRLMTGTVIGTGAMIASSTPPHAMVRRFAWLTDEGERTYRMQKFLDVAATVMQRRGIAMTDEYAAGLRELAGD